MGESELADRVSLYMLRNTDPDEYRRRLRQERAKRNAAERRSDGSSLRLLAR